MSMRASTQLCLSPDGLSAGAIFTPPTWPQMMVVHSRGDCTQRHDDDAVSTIILYGAGNSAPILHSHDDHSHDEGLVHAHEWATNSPMMR
jgi:hypothetical protein